MIPLPNKKYSIIYADPAWTYKVWSEKGDGRSASNHYTLSSLDAMKQIPVQSIAEKECALFMWATSPNLEEAFELGKAWGFIYKTVGFYWLKRNKKSNGWFMGNGHYTRSNVEPCLLFTTKKPPKVVSHSVHEIVETWETQICDARIMKHSEKPKEVRNKIVELFGNLPRIELFARQKTLVNQQVKGWDAWGNEIDGGYFVCDKEDDCVESVDRQGVLI